MIKYLLPLVLVACGSKAADDTSEVDFEDQEEETPEEVIEPPATTLDVQFIGAYGGFAVKDSINLAGPVFFEDGSEEGGNFAIILANEAWLSDANGMSNTTDACWIFFDLGIALTAESAVLDPDFISGDQWVGWTFSGAETFYGATESCTQVDTQLTALVEHFKTADFGVGLGAMDSDMEDTLAGQIGDEWEAEYKPYFVTQYVSIDFGDFGGPTGWSGTNYARGYQLEDDMTFSVETNEDGEEVNVLIDHTEATYAADGFYNGGVFYGLGLRDLRGNKDICKKVKTPEAKIMRSKNHESLRRTRFGSFFSVFTLGGLSG